MRERFLLTLLALCWGSTILAAAPAGTLERIIVHAPSLEQNLSGDTADRIVYVYLPPSYAKEPSRRYPVIYSLHGYSIDAKFQVDVLGFPASIDRAIGNGTAREMIVVTPDAMTVFGGSMYSSSPTTGDWESFIAGDLVTYIDSHYHSIPRREARGLAGHSMGGYGTLRIGMKHPEVFAALYSMSACCLPPQVVRPGDDALEKLSSREEVEAIPRIRRTTLAASAAWAPNPERAPLFMDLPTRDGQPQADVLARFAANAPQAMAPQYVPALKSFRAIAMDVGLADPLLSGNAEMERILTQLGVPHSYATYDGDHVNRIPERFEQQVLPFFSKQLSFDLPRRVKGR